MSLALPQLQFETSFVAPDLTRPGLRIHGPNKPADYALSLFEQGQLTREMLAAAGFFIFENQCIPNVLPREEGILGGDNTNQVLHQDNNQGDIVTFRAVPPLLCWDGRSGRARTALGDKEEVCASMRAYFEKLLLENPDSKWNHAGVRNVLAGNWEIAPNELLTMTEITLPAVELARRRGIDPDYSRKGVNEGQHVWMAEMASELPLYHHTYERNQWLMVDDRVMVHGRAENPNFNSRKDNGILRDEFNADENGHLVEAASISRGLEKPERILASVRLMIDRLRG
jgi:hypothetical protein